MPTRYNFRQAIHYLATQLLPWWEAEIHPNYCKHERKEWSYHGEVTGKGDMGNRVYHQVIQTAIAMRRQYNYPELTIIPHLNRESSGDVLEAILGLETLGYTPMDRKVRWCIEAACIGVASVWQNWLQGEWNTDTISRAPVPLS